VGRKHNPDEEVLGRCQWQQCCIERSKRVILVHAGNMGRSIGIQGKGLCCCKHHAEIAIVNIQELKPERGHGLVRPERLKHGMTSK
jgi:hypothetical protein